MVGHNPATLDRVFHAPADPTRGAMRRLASREEMIEVSGGWHTHLGIPVERNGQRVVPPAAMPQGVSLLMRAARLQAA